MAATLYAIADELVHLLELYEAGEIDEQTFSDTLDAGLKDATDSKLEAYCKLIKEREARAKARAEENKRLDAAAKVDENTVARLKERLKWFLEVTKKDSASAGIFTVAMQGNGGAQPIEIDPEVLADPTLAVLDDLEFFELVPSLDTARIRAHIEGGNELPFARLLPRGRSLRIR